VKSVCAALCCVADEAPDCAEAISASRSFNTLEAALASEVALAVELDDEEEGDAFDESRLESSSDSDVAAVFAVPASPLATEFSKVERLLSKLESVDDAVELDPDGGGGGGGPFSSFLWIEEASVLALRASPDCTSEISVLRSVRKGSLVVEDDEDEPEEPEDDELDAESSEDNCVFRLAARLCAVVVSPLAAASRSF
jgi:hypothetical protein